MRIARPAVPPQSMGSFPPKCRRRDFSLAFSLIELLVVVAVIGLLAALVAPATQSIIVGNAITRAADQLAGSLNLARQTAITKNRKVEVRFYELPALAVGGNAFCAFQLFEFEESGRGIPISPVLKLPSTAIISKDVQLSTLLDGSRSKSWSAVEVQPSLPGVGTDYDCRFVGFRPDGSTDLPIDKKWHLTVVSANSSGTAARPPTNFGCIWVEPSNAAVRILRP